MLPCHVMSISCHVIHVSCNHVSPTHVMSCVSTSCYVIMSRVSISWLYSFSHDHVTLCLCVWLCYVTLCVSSCHDRLYVSYVIWHSVSHHVMTVSQVMVVGVMLCLTWVPWVVTLGVTWVSLSWDMGCGPYLMHVIRPSCPLPSSECLGPFHGFGLKCPFVYPSLDLVLDCTLETPAELKINLSCTVSYSAINCTVVQWWTLHGSSVLYCTTLYCTIQLCNALYCIIMYLSFMQSMVLSVLLQKGVVISMCIDAASRGI